MDALRLPVWLTVCAMVVMLVRQQRPEFAVLAALAAGIIAFFMLKDELVSVIHWLEQAGTAIRAPNGAVNTMLKAGGIALISEFASDLCSDAGEKALAGRIDLAERILLTSMCIPFAAQMLEQIMDVMT